ncbi:hypothetical protein T06_11830 [Trichinella sp. T6]|nr:hypothetical protein T06_11830 [Trichinella sp. T6]
MCVKLSQVVSTTATANVSTFFLLREAVLTTFVYNNIARNQKNVSPIFKNVNPHFHEKTEKKSETTIKKKYNQKRNKSANIIKNQLGKEIIVVAARTGAAMQLITDRSICDTQHLECGVSPESTEDEYTGIA